MSTQNQHQSPQSNMEELPLNKDKDADIDRTTKRPKLVWLISIVFVGTVVIFDTFFIARLLGYRSDSEFAFNLSSLTAVDYLRRIVAGALSLAAGIYLFQLRKIATLLFLAILILNSSLFLHEKLSGETPSTSLFTLIIFGLIYWYTLRLKRQGILV